MFGFSVYLNQPFTTASRMALRQMRAAGFTEVFTSMHIPEDDVSQYATRIKALSTACREEHLQLMIDIEANSLQAVGLSLDNPATILAFGITGLRIDFGIDNLTIAKLSHHLQVALNASTITEKDLSALRVAGANFANMEAWHNYYPRNETGLERTWFTEKNQWLKAQGLTIQAFVPGDGTLRGPLEEGLPTLEAHRHQHPLASAFDLFNCATDKVFIGDPTLSPTTLTQFATFYHHQVLILQILKTVHCPSYLFNHIFHNRRDVARDVVRLEEGRSLCKTLVQPEQTLERSRGCITLDNQNYGRYMGELQIIKRDLPADSRVNVLGKVIPKDQALLPFIQAGQAIQLKEIN
ncbi:DUF871 family protein [Lactobacillus curvatus]|nr:DUF871 family protein [Latilactobacillus curvatus]MSE24017.1 DUF871 family protein [Latilactobacillus curvatus]